MTPCFKSFKGTGCHVRSEGHLLRPLRFESLILGGIWAKVCRQLKLIARGMRGEPVLQMAIVVEALVFLFVLMGFLSNVVNPKSGFRSLAMSLSNC